MLKSNTSLNDVKTYYESCTSFALHQLIKVSARITCNSSIIVNIV